MEKDYTSIPLKPSTKARLSKQSEGRESWDELLNRLLDELEEKKPLEVKAR